MKYQHTYALNDCIEKHLTTIFSLSRVPVDIFCLGKSYEFLPAEVATVSPNFYRGVKCQGSGRCCRRYWCIWDATAPMPEGLESTTVVINGEKKKIFYSTPPKDREYHCKFFKQHEYATGGICTVYADRPLSSRMPHVFLSRRNNRVQVSKRQYSRNHQLGCLARVKEFDYKEYQEEDLPTLMYLRGCIKTYQNPENSFIDEIIQLTKEGADGRLDAIRESENNVQV